MPKVIPGPNGSPERIARRFHTFLRSEVRQGNPHLHPQEQALLRGHYPVMMHPENFSPELVATIYSRRRAPAVQAVLETERPLVFDAGCGFGSESFLLAAVGARVLALDRSAGQLEIALKRRHYYEEIFGRPLEITFRVADLDEFIPPPDLSLTWLGSVLAAVRDQEIFLEKVYGATRSGGEVMVSDMNLFNPLFLWGEWRRRKRAREENRAFSRQADFWAMFARRGRRGARYFPGDGAGLPFDDVQFFSALTLERLLSKVGFFLRSPFFHGFSPPRFHQLPFTGMEGLLSRIPALRYFGYFYVVTGWKNGRKPLRPARGNLPERCDLPEGRGGTR